jgi:CheY-like chemotaxis protein
MHLRRLLRTMAMTNSASERSKRIRHIMTSRRVLVVDSDALTQSLLAEWLEADGWQVLLSAADDVAARDLGLIVLDMPFPKAGSLDALRALRTQYAAVPVIVISSTVFASVGCWGPCAASLGVDGVLPKPVSRDALIGAARRLVDAQADTPRGAR